MKTSTILPAALLLPLLSTSLAAQTADHLVGLTRMFQNLRHVDHRACVHLTECNVPMPIMAGLPRWAGGTAWDPTTGGAWFSDGHLLAKVDDQCNSQCAWSLLSMLTPNVYVTGLEVVESRNQLVVLDSEGRLHFFTNACPPVHLSTCFTGLSPGLQQRYAAGLAIDEGQNLVFISYSDFATGDNTIAITGLGNPCAVTCTVTPPSCGTNFGAFTGLAVDWGRRILYATDGDNTMAMEYVPALGCVTFVNYSCCMMPASTDYMVGLAVRPGRETRTGQACGNGACPSCPNVHTLGNDPNLGNGSFHLRLDQAPVGSLAWCIVGAAPCSTIGVLVPPLCGPIFAQPVLGTLGPVPVTGPGVGGCNGSARFAFPLPLDPGLAGWTMSSQCVALCVAAAGLGTGVSNCISFTLQGN